MSHTEPRQPRRPLPWRLLGWFGLAAALGSPAVGAVAAELDAERAALDARVQSVRDALQRAPNDRSEQGPADTIAQWFNWPNWNNWNNWPNWGKWLNTR